MKTNIVVIASCVALMATSHAAVAGEDALRLAGRTELPGYTGDFDHFEYDLKGDRLWLAAEDHGTLDLFDLKTAKMQKSFKGVVDTPHAILYVPEKSVKKGFSWQDLLTPLSALSILGIRAR